MLSQHKSTHLSVQLLELSLVFEEMAAFGSHLSIQHLASFSSYPPDLNKHSTAELNFCESTPEPLEMFVLHMTAKSVSTAFYSLQITQTVIITDTEN